MSFKYINPGYAKFLNSTSSAGETTDSTKTKTGIGFYNTASNTGFTLKEFPSTGEFWAKFDLYIPEITDGGTYCYAPGGYQNGIWISPQSISWRSNTRVTVYACYNNGSYTQMAVADGADNILETLGIKLNAVNTFLMRVKYGASGTGFIDLTINNKTLDRFQNGNISYSSTSNKDVIMYTNVGGSTTFFLSNIIFSDEEINPKEQIIRLTAGTTEGTMTYDSETGIYTASALNQNLLQSVNVNSLIDTYGSDSKVTGIVLIGNPAYRTGEEISNLTSLQKANGTTTEKETFSLSTDSDSAIVSAWQTATDTTIADIGNMQFGWRAGA